MNTRDSQLVSAMRSLIREEVPPLIDEAITKAIGDTVPGMIHRETQPLAAGLASLSRVVDRIDQRLVTLEQTVGEMKQRTDLIPNIYESLTAVLDEQENHAKRLRRLERAAA